MALDLLLVLAIVQVRTDGADGADEDDVEGEMKKVVSLVEPVCVIFPQSVLIIGQKGVFMLILGYLCKVFMQ